MHRSCEDPSGDDTCKRVNMLSKLVQIKWSVKKECNDVVILSAALDKGTECKHTACEVKDLHGCPLSESVQREKALVQ